MAGRNVQKYDRSLKLFDVPTNVQSWKNLTELPKY